MSYTSFVQISSNFVSNPNFSAILTILTGDPADFSRFKVSTNCPNHMGSETVADQMYVFRFQVDTTNQPVQKLGHRNAHCFSFYDRPRVEMIFCNGTPVHRDDVKHHTFFDICYLHRHTGINIIKLNIQFIDKAIIIGEKNQIYLHFELFIITASLVLW